MESLYDAYVEMVNNFSDKYFINTVTCRAHLNYIARLSKFNKRKALSILDSGADTHVFGIGRIPFFVQGPNTKTADLIGFDNVHARKHGLAIGPHAALVRTSSGKKIILRAAHGVSNPSANHTLLCSYQCREVGVIVDDCHKKHLKSIDGTMGTQSICFRDKTTIDLHCRLALMTFETEEFTIKDFEKAEYPIYDIATPDWNLREHFDDPYGIDIHVNHNKTVGDNKHELETQSDDGTIPQLVARNIETESIDDTIPSLLDSSLQQDTFDLCYGISNQAMLNDSHHDHATSKCEIPWEIGTQYQDNEKLSTISLMGIDLDYQNECHINDHTYDSKDPHNANKMEQHPDPRERDQDTSFHPDGQSSDCHPVQLYASSTTKNPKIDLNEKVMDYRDDDEYIPTDADLEKQYHLFCTRKSQIEASTLPSEMNKEQFYDCNETEVEEFFDTNQYHDICHVTNKKSNKPFHLKINNIALEKGQTH